MKYGYARVSTQDQNLDLQVDELKRNGVEDKHIFTDTISGSTKQRPALDELLNTIQKGDTLVVWKLDRLGRSLRQLVTLIETFREQKIEFISLQDKIDTTTPMGKLIFHMNCAYAEFERGIIQERTKAGLKAARARGRMGGRPKKLSEKEQRKLKEMYESKTHTIEELKKFFGVSNNTLYRVVRS